MDHVSFTEAVERLAGRIGFTLHYEDGGATPDTTGRTRLYAANAAAAEFFRGQLATAEAGAARRFLGERGFDAGAAAHFGVGYAPRGWSGMHSALRARGLLGRGAQHAPGSSRRDSAACTTASAAAWSGRSAT